MTYSFLRHRVLTLIAPLLISFTATAAIPPAERLLPDSTLLVVTVPDFNRFRELPAFSPQMQLWNDPAMKPFRDHFMSKFREGFVEPLERELGIKVEDYTTLPQGQVTFAVTRSRDEAGDPEPGFLFLIDTKEKSSQLTTNLAALRRKWVDSGKAIKSETIRGIEFSVFAVSGSDMPVTLQKLFPSVPEGEGWTSEDETNRTAQSDWVVGQHQSLLVLADSVRTAERIAVHLTGGSMPSLADLAAFDEVRGSMFRDAPLYAWANVKGFLDLIAGEPEEEESPLAFLNPEKLLGALGLSSIRSIAGTVESTPEGSLFHMFANIPESTRQGLLGIFPSEPLDASPPAFVPGDVVKFQRSRIDGQKAWAAIQQTMNNISPSLIETLNYILDAANESARQRDPDFDIKRNLFGNLGDDMITYEKAPAGTNLAELQSPPSLFLIGSPRPEQLADGLRSVLVFLNQQGSQPTEREFLGRRIYSLPLSPVLSSVTGQGRPGGSRTLHYAASGGYVALTTHMSMLEEFLRSSEGVQRPLRETAGLREASARAGGMTTGIFGYENQAETTRTLLTVLKNSGTNAPAQLPGMPVSGAPNPFRQWMDPSLLPAFDQIAKYFTFSVHTFSTTAQGMSLKVYAPTPPDLRRER